jgi:hypothetical protein
MHQAGWQSLVQVRAAAVAIVRPYMCTGAHQSASAV